MGRNTCGSALNSRSSHSGAKATCARSIRVAGLALSCALATGHRRRIFANVYPSAPRISIMRGYVIHHRSRPLGRGLRGDYYFNDPFIWFAPYLWSFCHLNQNPLIEQGMTVVWISKHERQELVCDLIFVVGQIMPFAEALHAFGPRNEGLAFHHFGRGRQQHPEVRRARAKTYIADMRRSYMPVPSVPIANIIDQLRKAQNPASKPLRKICKRPTSPLRILEMDRLSQYIAQRAKCKRWGPMAALPPTFPVASSRSWTPEWTSGWVSRRS
jgi:hypothetical protein